MTGPFRQLAAAGFGSALIPIVPPDAKMHDGFPGFDERRGKTPGIFFNGAWAPKKDWLNFKPDIEQWDRWNCGAGLRARDYPGVDIDVLDEGLAGEIERICVRVLGPAPVRVGQWPKRLLSYRAAVPFSKRSLRLGSVGTVEILGDGQQYVVAGVHPRTAKPYHWVNGHNLLNLGAAGLTVVTAADVDRLLEELAAWAEIMGLEADLTAGGAAGVAAVSQKGLEAPNFGAVADALAAIGNDLDYDGWIVLGRAVKAACAGYAELGLDDGFELWSAWSARLSRNVPLPSLEECQYKWDSFVPPHGVGWHHLASLAQAQGFNAAALDFEVVELLREAPGDLTGSGGSGISPGAAAETRQGEITLDEVLVQWGWVEKLEAAVEIATGKTLGRIQFNVLFHRLGDPADSRKCAWARFLRHPKLIYFDRTTYRPGLDRIHVEEDGDKCVNTWRPSRMLPTPSTADDVKIWFEHIEWLIPEERERQHVIDFLAFLVQYPQIKVNYALMLKSETHGVGKDLLIDPIVHWLGEHNVSYVGPDDLSGKYTDWCADRKVALIEEVHSFEKRSTMQKLKTYITVPPNQIRINRKNIAQYYVPNILTFIMFTNQPDALAIEHSDRRFFIVDCPHDTPKDEAYYLEFKAWYCAGGEEKVVGYLQGRDVRHFNPGGRAPSTEAKTAMQRMTMSKLDVWLYDRIQEEVPPFASPLVALAEVKAALPPSLSDTSSERLAHSLRRLGAVVFPRIRLDAMLESTGSDRVRIFAVRQQEVFRGLHHLDLARLFVEKRSEILKRRGFA